MSSEPIAHPEDPENWDPLALVELNELLRGVNRPWWVAGGMAIDLHLGHDTRVHHDLDVMVLRDDVNHFQEVLRGWDLRIPTGKWVGQPNQSDALFIPWTYGTDLPEWAGQAWCRRGPHERWSFELLISPGLEGRWAFKRDLSITRPISTIGGTSKQGVPYLLPEIVLLHKATSSYVGEFADADFRSCIPAMDKQAIAWLRGALERVAPDHHWIEQLPPAEASNEQE